MNDHSSMIEQETPLSDQRLNNALDGLEEYFYDHLKNRISKLNALTIVNYILAMKVETNLSTNHKRGVVTSLKLLSQFLDDKPFKEMTKEDLLAFLDSIRRPETKDPTHKWIESYNQRLINSLRFFNPNKIANTSFGRKGLIMLLFVTMTTASIASISMIDDAEAGGRGLRVICFVPKRL
jgi:hypothetical protein